MMALQLKNDREVKEAVQGSQEALNENNVALHNLLECLYGVGSVGRKRIALLIERSGDDGKDNPKCL